MADIKVNPETGELAIPQAGGWKIYAKGQYKFDPSTGKYAVPVPGGKWKLYQHEKHAAPLSLLPMRQDIVGNNQLDFSEGIYGTIAGIPKSIWSGLTAPGDVASGKLNPDSPEGERRAMEAAGLMVGVNPFVVSGERAIPGAAKNMQPRAVATPTVQELKSAAGAGYTKAEGMGVDYASTAIKSLGDEIDQALQSKGIREKRAPGTFDTLNEIRQPPADSVVSLTGLREIRAALNDIAGDFGAATTKTDRKAAQDAIRALDQFMEKPPIASVMDRTSVGDAGTSVALSGPDAFNEAIAKLRAKQQNATEAGATIKEANANYAAAARAENVAGKLEKAELDAAAANSGLNLDNRTRQILKAIIDPERPRNRRGFSQEELAVVEQIVRGNPGTNVARYFGNLMGGGGGLGSLVSSGAGAAFGSLLGPWGAAAGAAIPPALGWTLRNTAGRLTTRAGNALEEQLRQRSPLYQQRAAGAGVEPVSREALATFIRGLFASGIQPPQGGHGGAR